MREQCYNTHDILLLIAGLLSNDLIWLLAYGSFLNVVISFVIKMKPFTLPFLVRVN